MVLAVFNCIVIPLEIAFEPGYVNNIFYIILNSLIDFMFFLDIIITFRTTYFDRGGNEIYDPKEISRHYLKGQFWSDLLATIPFDKFTGGVK